MPIRFYFVRHGQSDANLRSDYYNEKDAKLTRLGEAQAAMAGINLKNYGVDFKAIFCSPYKRAIDTYKIAMARANMLSMLATIDDRISERKFDGLVGQEADETRNRKLYSYKSNQSVIDGVEPLDDLERRARQFIDEIVRDYQDGNILLFSHGAFGLAFRAAIEGRPETGNLCDWNEIKFGEIKIFEV